MLFTSNRKKLLFYSIQKAFLWFLLCNFPYYIHKSQIKQLEIEVWISPWNIYPALSFLKTQTLCQFQCLVDIIVYDVLRDKKRFHLIYNLLSTQFNYRLRIVTKTCELLPLLSVSSLFNSSNWMEREIWDLYGIFFLLHKDLRRILTEYGFKNHPLRKDFPLTGFFEVIYDDSQKRIINRPLELSQEYRYFDFNSSWALN
jgi:NADH dehydrogenase (ubiquinone) Fe-S protein 3